MVHLSKNIDFIKLQMMIQTLNGFALYAHPVGTTLGRYVFGMCQACISNTHPLSIHYVLVKQLNLFHQLVVGMHS